MKKPKSRRSTTAATTLADEALVRCGNIAALAQLLCHVGTPLPPEVAARAGSLILGELKPVQAGLHQLLRHPPPRR